MPDETADEAADCTAGKIVDETEIELACPHCGQAVVCTPASSPQVLICPSCGGEFIAPAAEGATDVAEDAQLPDEVLTAIRIRQLSAERRATYRASSYAVIAAGACLITSAQLVWMIVQHVRQRGWGIQCTGYVLFIVLGLYGLVYFIRRTRQLHEEAKRSSLVDPLVAPDFSTLDDGSKRVTNLEQIR